MAFEKTHEYLEKNSNYDVIVTDYLIIGAHLAAEVHNIPVVTHYVGPLLITLESDPESFMSLIYIPETRHPFSFPTKIELSMDLFPLCTRPNPLPPPPLQLSGCIFVNISYVHDVNIYVATGGGGSGGGGGERCGGSEGERSGGSEGERSGGGGGGGGY